VVAAGGATTLALRRQPSRIGRRRLGLPRGRTGDEGEHRGEGESKEDTKKVSRQRAATPGVASKGRGAGRRRRITSARTRSRGASAFFVFEWNRSRALRREHISHPLRDGVPPAWEHFRRGIVQKKKSTSVVGRRKCGPTTDMFSIFFLFKKFELKMFKFII
jgi:hypothetical protein